jgi:hypothetical protein
MKILQIISGTINNIVGRNKDLMFFRTEYGCKRCAIGYDKDKNYTGWCQKDQGGCGCNTPSKASLKGARCPNGVWANRWLSQNALVKINKDNNFQNRNPIQSGVMLELDAKGDVVANLNE